MTKPNDTNKPKIRPEVNLDAFHQPQESPLILLLTPKEIIRVLDEFTLQHSPQLYDGADGMLEGLTDSRRKLISLTQDNTQYARYATIIHELIHASDIIRTGNSNEQFTKKREKINFKSIYGYDYKG